LPLESYKLLLIKMGTLSDLTTVGIRCIMDHSTAIYLTL